ncbi:hypothetical protein ACFL20_04870 [Spirochaetota bacterium]
MSNKNNKDDPGKIITGGFSGIGIDSKASIDAFNFLKEELLKKQPGIILLQILKAEEQVVAGSNIGLICQYKKPKDKQVSILYAKIYVDLQDKYELDQLEFDPGKFPEELR